MSEAREDPAAARAARSSGDVPDAIHDDDELAAALQAQLERFAPSGPIPIIPAELAEQDRRRRAGEAPAGGPAASAPAAPTSSPAEPAAAPLAAVPPAAVPPVAVPPAPEAARSEPVGALPEGRPSWPPFAQADRPAGSHAAPPVEDEGRNQRRPSGRRAERSSPIPTRLPTGPIPTLGRTTPPPSVPDLRFSSPVPHFQPPAPLRSPEPEPVRPPSPPAAEAAAPPAPAGSPERRVADEPTRAEPATPPAEGRTPESTAADAALATDLVPAAGPRPDPLTLLEQLQPRLAQVRLDPETYREWERSLREVSESAPPPPVTGVLSTLPAAFPPRAGSTPPTPTPAPQRPAFDPLGVAPAPVPAPPASDPAGLTASALGLPPLGAPPTEPVPVGVLRGVPIAEPHEDDEVISAELVEDDDEDEGWGSPGAPDDSPAAAPEAPSTGVVPVQASPMPATGSAALAFRSRRSAPPPADPAESGEVEALDLDGITANTGPLPTGSMPIITALDRDLDDDVDDLAAPEELLPVTGSVPISDLADTGSVAPVPSASVRTGVITVPTTAHTLPSPFAVEAADLRPTEEEQRLRRPVAQFWLWLAPNASALTLALGGALLALGVSFRQAVVAAIVGVVLACLTLAVDVLAVKRTAQPVAVVSRAAFGLRGNLLPTIVLLLARLFWSVALAWLAAGTVRAVVAAAGWEAVSPAAAGVAAAVVLPVVAGLIAVFGHGLLARVHLVLGILSVALLLVLVVLTAPMLDLTAVLAIPDGSPLRLVAAAVAVFSLLALAWASAGGELARYQQPGSSGSATSAWASLGAAAPALLLIVWGLLLSGSSPADPLSLDVDPVAALLDRLPAWAPVPLLFAVLLGLVAALATVLYSTGLTLGAAGVRGARSVRTVPAAAIAIAGGVALLLAAPPTVAVLADLVPVVAVPVAAWTGLVAAEFVLRTRPFDPDSLLRSGRRYPDVRWPMVAALAGLTVVGIGLVGRSDYAPFAGYLWTLFGADNAGDLAQSDLGVLLALLLGFVVPFLTGRAEVRRQERWTPDAPSDPAPDPEPVPADQVAAS
ncbi:cytosine permease [Naasia sp. SYSU D00057]|uniref:cytosine permease n=1 Tax=Naasia sp. SYSU D00057 TaxID=2817380 RepID=UPI001B304026|nr:cytosine permease [Naasia sp. SYSU D00057]